MNYNDLKYWLNRQNSLYGLKIVMVCSLEIAILFVKRP